VLKLASEINAEISTFSSIHNEKLSKVISGIRHLLLHRVLIHGLRIVTENEYDSFSVQLVYFNVSLSSYLERVSLVPYAWSQVSSGRQ
jgi:phosphopantetheine adenylyltransferase